MLWCKHSQPSLTGNMKQSQNSVCVQWHKCSLHHSQHDFIIMYFVSVAHLFVKLFTENKDSFFKNSDFERMPTGISIQPQPSSFSPSNIRMWTLKGENINSGTWSTIRSCDCFIKCCETVWTVWGNMFMHKSSHPLINEHTNRVKKLVTLWV